MSRVPHAAAGIGIVRSVTLGSDEATVNESMGVLPSSETVTCWGSLNGPPGFPTFK